MTYYDEIAKGYDELHKEEQEKKLKIVKQYIKPKKNETLLDIGCGTGISSDFDCKVTGIDPSEELLKIAKKNHPKAKFIQTEAEHLPFPNKSFDYVISLTAAQNFTDLKQAVDEIMRVMKKKAAISILKKSPKAKMLKPLLNDWKEIEEEKDIIYLKF
jgi:ubiquinone/menaquinone biosynthesis C-methylase UbiE